MEIPKASGTIIAVGNQKGGVGKSTVTVHLAHALAKAGSRVLIIDLDKSGDAAVQLGIRGWEYEGVHELLTGERALEEVILKNGVDGIELPEGLDLIPADETLEIVEQELRQAGAATSPAFPYDLLQPHAQTLTEQYDYVLLDTAPQLTTGLLSALGVAEWFIVVVSPEQNAIRHGREMAGHIDAANRRSGHICNMLGTVLSMVKTNTIVGKEAKEIVEESFTIRTGIELMGEEIILQSLFPTNIKASQQIVNAQSQGKTILSLAPSNPVAKQFTELALEVEQRIATLNAYASAPTQEGQLEIIRQWQKRESRKRKKVA